VFLAITTVVEELLSLGRSRDLAIVLLLLDRVASPRAKEHGVPANADKLAEQIAATY
jgi:hypothetical protein